MKTKIYRNTVSGAEILLIKGEVYFKDAGARLSAFDLTNESDLKEFITDVIIGGGYAEGCKSVREDGIGGQTFESALKHFNEIIRPLFNI